MPVCRHCGSRITKFDTDRCPICGELNPLEGVNSDTIEITSEVDLSSADFSAFKPRKKTTTLLLSCLIGWLGSTFFYLGYKKFGLFWLLGNVLVIGGSFSAFFFGLNNLLLAILIPAVLAYLVNIIVGLYLYKNPTLKDSDGNLLK